MSGSSAFSSISKSTAENHKCTRNQRLAALHCLFEYIAGRAPEMLLVCRRVAGMPMKRAAPAETRFLERDEVEDLLRQLPRDGRLALRDRTLLLILVLNTSISVTIHSCACTARVTSGAHARSGVRRLLF